MHLRQYVTTACLERICLPMYFNYSVYMDIVLQEYTEISWILNTSNTKKIVHH